MLSNRTGEMHFQRLGGDKEHSSNIYMFELAMGVYKICLADNNQMKAFIQHFFLIGCSDKFVFLYTIW